MTSVRIAAHEVGVRAVDAESDDERAFRDGVPDAEHRDEVVGGDAFVQVELQLLRLELRSEHLTRSRGEQTGPARRDLDL